MNKPTQKKTDDFNPDAYLAVAPGRESADPYAGLGTPVSGANPFDQFDEPRKGPNPFDKFDAAATPAANPFDQFDPDAYLRGQSLSGKAGDAAKLTARGASSEGFYFGLQGLSRAAQFSAPKLAADIPGTDAAGIDVNLDRLRARRRELLGEPSAYSTSASAESLPVSLPDEKAIAEIDADIAQLEARKKGNDTAISAPMKWYADAVRDTREKIKKGLPVAEESEQALWGQIAQGVGQAIGTLPTYVIPGLGPATTVGQLYQQGYEDALASGADEVTAHDAGIKNVPAASLEYLSDRLIIGNVLKPLKGKLTVRQLLTGLATTAAAEGATEGAQQTWQNYVAGSLSGYDPDRPLDDGVINAVVVGAAVGGIIGGGGPVLAEGARRLENADDTGQNKPERPEDLPMAVITERGPNGEELRGALATPSTAEATKAALEAGKSADSTVQVEPLQETLARRDVAGDIERSLPDGESKDYVRGRTKKELQSQAEINVDLPELWRETVDAVLAAGVSSKEFSALDRNLELLADKEGRKKAGLKTKLTTERINSMLGNTVLDGALRSGSKFTRLVNALAADPANIEALRAEFAKAREVPSVQQSAVPPGPSPEVAKPTPEPSTVSAARPFRLPAELAGAKPRYGYKENQFELTFESQLDKALYILAQSTPSKQDAKFLQAVTTQTGMSEAEARAAGQKVRARIKEMAAKFQLGGKLTVPDEAGQSMRARLREQIAAEAEQKRQADAELARKKATAENALAVAAEKRKAETARLAAIDRTGRDPETGLIADLRKVPSAELENFDWEKDRYMHGGDEVKAEDIDAILMKRAQDEERAAATENRAGYTLLGLLKGKPADLKAAGLATPLRLMSPKEARDRGTLGGEHARLRERTGGFAFFSRDGLVEDGLEEALRELGFDVPDTAAAYALVERAMNGEEIQPMRSEESQVQFSTRDPEPAVAERPKAVVTREEQRTRLRQLAEDWERNMEAIAPGFAREAELRIGSARALAAAGHADPETLSGQEEAAHLQQANRTIIYLFHRALLKNTDDVTRINLQHEMAHAFWQTLDASTRDRLHELWFMEMRDATDPHFHSGPLFDDNGKLRKGVGLGVAEDAQEWFVERLAHANDSWAKRRIEANRGRGETLIGTISAEFRTLLLRIREFLEARFRNAGYDEQLLADFRRFLDQGARWSGVRQGDEGTKPMYARRATTDAEFNEALRTFDRLERESQRQLESYGKTDRAVLERLSEARMTLENSWPGWRDAQKEMHAEEEANASLPPEPEAGVSTDADVREIAPEETAWKRSRLEASSFRPPGKISEWVAGLGRLFTNFRSAIPELPGGAAGRTFTRFRQGFRMMKAATEAVRHEAESRIAHVLEPITELGSGAIAPNDYSRLVNVTAAIKALEEKGERVPAKLRAELTALEEKLETLPYHLFRKTVLYRDLWFRSRIPSPSGQPITLPMNLTRAEVENALQDLHSKIAASPDRGAIEESLRRHYALVKTTRDELLARGYIIPEELRNPLYFPHLVLEKFSGRLQSVKLDTASDFRSYLQQLVGSAKDIETDYLSAMYYHLGQVMAHNAREDIVADYWQPYDIKEKLVADAKAINAKRAEEGLGPLSWQQLVPSDHTIYVVDRRIPLRPGYIIDRQVLAERLGVELGSGDLQAQLRELGMDVTISPDDITSALLADEKITWVVPRPVSAALRGIVERDTQRLGGADALAAKTLGYWKQYILHAPWNAFRYNYGNFVSDFEKLFAADPAVFTQLRPALREVRAFYAGAAPSNDFKEAFQRGVIDGITVGEVGGLREGELQQFEKFLTSEARFKAMLSRRLGWSKGFSRVREATFRYAKFKTDVERLRRGESPLYAGAYWRDVEAIEDSKPGAGDAIYAKAAEIARKTFGDYDDISVSGDGLRKKLIPFYSWMEVNFKYHANLFRNVLDLKAGARTSLLARGTAVGASKVLLPRSAAGVLMRLALPYVAVGIWNNSGEREELEKSLSVEDRRRFHIIWGRDLKGNLGITYLPTAFSDVARWFGGNRFVQLATEYTRGDIPFDRMVHEWGSNLPKDVLNNLLGSVRPEVQTAFVALAGKKWFPDVFDMRSIPPQDYWWRVLDSMVDPVASDEIRRLVDRDYYPSRSQWEVWSQAILQIRRRDPEQAGYWATLDRVEAWKQAHGGSVEISRKFGGEAEDENLAEARLLASFSRALRKADVPAASQLYRRLLSGDDGRFSPYTKERFAAKVRFAEPLQRVAKDQRQAFVDQLASAEKRDLENAYRFYQRMETFKGHEQQLFPSKAASPGYKARFAQHPRDDIFAGLMLKAAARDDDEEELRAEKLLELALRKR